GCTVLLVTHQMLAAESACDRLIWIEGGRVLADGSPVSVAADYRRHVTRLALRPDHYLSDARVPMSQDPAQQQASASLPRLVSARLEHADGSECDHAETDQPLRLVFSVDGTR